MKWSNWITIIRVIITILMAILADDNGLADDIIKVAGAVLKDGRSKKPAAAKAVDRSKQKAEGTNVS